jgi:hypothetical protein
MRRDTERRFRASTSPDAWHEGVMNESGDAMHRLGAFEPAEAKRLLPALEAAGIPFEIEADHSALAQPGRWMQLYFGMYPDGSKLAVFVPESRLEHALAEAQRLFPL